MESIRRNSTRAVRIGRLTIGVGHPIAVQSMAASPTRNIQATVEQVDLLHRAGADVVRIAVDSRADAQALVEIRRRTEANLAVDLQENYRLIELVAPHVDKVRYNPGHLHHHEPEKSWKEKVRYIAQVALDNDCALRVGVNCGSVDPDRTADAAGPSGLHPMLCSALEHCQWLDELGFTRYCVSLKDSDPGHVVRLNRDFARLRPDVPLHLGVTEAGMPPEAIVKTRRALEPLLAEGIGDTLRVSLTVPSHLKGQEIEAGRAILEDVQAGRIGRLEPAENGLNIISCPSCSRVENEAFVELAQRVREATRYAKDYPLTIAVMGCRVNGPGETDDADLGLWCGPRQVFLKRGAELVGAFDFDEILDRLRRELDALIADRYSP